MYPLHAYAVVAAGRLTRFEATAAANGSSNWLGLDAMVGAAIKRRRADIAVRLLDAADVPGRYQERSPDAAWNSRLDMPSHACGCRS